MKTVIEAPATAEAEQEQQVIITDAQALVVSSPASHEIALGMLKAIAGAEKKVKDLFAEPKRAAHAAHKAITQAEAKLLDPLGKARQIVTGKAVTFEADQRRKAEEEARRLAAEAKQREEEAALADAIDAEASGDTAAAEQIMETPIEAPVVTVAPQVAQVSGVSSRETWSAEVTDLAALVAYVASRPEWINLLLPNEQALNSLARAQRAALKIPGVRAVAKRGLSVRAS
jgi:hypothetical protein